MTTKRGFSNKFKASVSRDALHKDKYPFFGSRQIAAGKHPPKAVAVQC